MALDTAIEKYDRARNKPKQQEADQQLQKNRLT
jgi:hypothetical protein